MAAGIAGALKARPILQFTPPSAFSKDSVITKGTAGMRPARSGPRSAAVANSCSFTAYSAPTGPAESSNPNFFVSRSRLAGTTMCCAPSTISSPSRRPTIHDSRMRSKSFVATNSQMAAGPCRTVIPERPGSKWNKSGSQAAGTPSAPSASSSGGTLLVRSHVPRRSFWIAAHVDSVCSRLSPFVPVGTLSRFQTPARSRAISESERWCSCLAARNQPRNWVRFAILRRSSSPPTLSANRKQVCRTAEGGPQLGSFRKLNPAASRLPPRGRSQIPSLPTSGIARAKLGSFSQYQPSCFLQLPLQNGFVS
jgi:hypothetical protein